MTMTTSEQILPWPDYCKTKENVNITLLDVSLYIYKAFYMPNNISIEKNYRKKTHINFIIDFMGYLIHTKSRRKHMHQKKKKIKFDKFDIVYENM